MERKEGKKILLKWNFLITMTLKFRFGSVANCCRWWKLKKRTNRFVYENECKFFIFWLISRFPSSSSPFRRHYHLSKASERFRFSLRQTTTSGDDKKLQIKAGTMRDVETAKKKEECSASLGKAKWMNKAEPDFMAHEKEKSLNEI